MPSGCDAACQKIIIDTGMGTEAALLYARVLDGIAGVQPVQRSAPRFYAGVVELSRQVAQAMNQGRESDDQKIRIAAQIQKSCYRADELIAWSRMPNAAIIEHLERWTAKVFEWAKDDQDFFTAMIREIGSSPGTVH